MGPKLVPQIILLHPPIYSLASSSHHSFRVKMGPKLGSQIVMKCLPPPFPPPSLGYCLQAGHKQFPNQYFQLSTIISESSEASSMGMVVDLARSVVFHMLRVMQGRYILLQ